MKTFEIITESDARVLERGETVTLAMGGHITPLAQDTLNERRVKVLRADQVSDDDATLAPRAEIRSVAIGSDHTGIELRRTLVTFLRGRGLAVAMCEHSLEVARQIGFTAMQFNFVVATNTAAVRAWERCGFAVIGRIPGAYRHKEQGFVDALVMYRAL